MTRLVDHGIAATTIEPDQDERGAFRLPARVLLTSTAFPPLKAGHAVVLDRLFRGIHPADYRIVHFDEFSDHDKLDAGWSALPGKTMRYPRGQWEYDPGYRLSYVRWLRQFVGEVTDSARTLARVCADEECEAIIVTTGSLPCLPAAVLAGRMARVPVILLIWDIWRYMEIQPLRRFVAETLEPTVLRQAAAVVVPNEMAAESIERISGVRPVIIRLPTEDAAFQPPTAGASVSTATDGFNLVFTGQIYLSMPESYKRLLAALELPGMKDVTLHIHGPQKKKALKELGLKGRYVCHGFSLPSEIYGVQRAADALFLTLAFEGDHKDLVYSSSTSKLADYLASGRPILVHAPPGSFPAWYVRRHDCGLVVETPDPMALARAIAMLRDDESLRRRLSRNAMMRAREDFSIATAQQRLADLLASVVDAA